MNYYNEFDPYAAEWLRNLIAAPATSEVKAHLGGAARGSTPEPAAHDSTGIRSPGDGGR